MSPLRRICLGIAWVCLLPGVIGAADSPFAGTWKVSVPNQKFDVSLWILEVDAAASKVSLVAGLEAYAQTRIGSVKATPRSLEVNLTAGPNTIQLQVQAPGKGKKEELLGAMLLGSNILPLWLQRTTMTELAAGSAVKEAPGFADLQEAIKLTEAPAKQKAIRAIIDRNTGQPIHFLALQALLGERIKEKADEKVFRALVGEYRKLAERHGELFLAGANLDLARNLLGHKPSQSVAVEAASEAARLMKPEYPAALRLTALLTLGRALELSGKTDASQPVAAKLAATAEELIKAGKTREESLAATQNLAAMFLGASSGPVADRGLELARRSAKLTEKDTSVAQRTTALRLLERALLARNRPDEAKKLASELNKLEEQLDAAYLKEALEFKREKITRKSKETGQVVLVELFTGLSHRPALAATLAFDAARTSAAPTDVVFLQYHVIFPDADILVTPASEVRKTFYTADLEGVPAVFVNGKLTEPLGGARQRVEASYSLLRDAITQALESDPGARIKLEVTRIGETLTARAKVQGLMKTGAGVRLRFALVEERIRFEGPSGVRLHHHLVRAFLDGGSGLRLDKAESTQTASINLVQLRKGLGEYLDGLAAKAGTSLSTKPLALEHLKVIAFIQDEETKQVLAAAQADVPAR
ncbi:MAG: hypothetical protein U0840_30410 [Gemmataceae bacterium]